MIIEVENREDKLINNLVLLWDNSVKSTHLFLSNEEIDNIKKYVPNALNMVSHLIVLYENDEIVGFMGIEGNKLEMLFIKSTDLKRGYGKKLLEYGIKKNKVNCLTVNEQNPNAISFYEHLGFVTYKRSKLDEQGNSYPILYMKCKR